MPMYFYLVLFFVAGMILLFIYISSSAKSRSSVELYMEALKNENSGRLKEALILYENAFEEAKRVRMNNSFKSKIVEKLRVLHTVIEYNQSLAIRKTTE